MTSSHRKHYVNAKGKLHRTDGPAVEWSDGRKEWYLNGKRHRTDGPAVEWTDGHKSWWLNGEVATEEQFNNKLYRSLYYKNI